MNFPTTQQAGENFQQHKQSEENINMQNIFLLLKKAITSYLVYKKRTFLSYVGLNIQTAEEILINFMDMTFGYIRFITKKKKKF